MNSREGKEGEMKIYITKISRDAKGREVVTISRTLEFDATTPARKSAIVEAVEASVLALAELTGEELRVTLG